jgi:excisionase family DNA binding protein
VALSGWPNGFIRSLVSIGAWMAAMCERSPIEPEGGRAMTKTPYTSGTRERLIERLRRQATAVQNGHRRDDALLTTGEVAMLFRVSHRAVRCWADAGKLPYIRTLGGHRRFLASAVWDALSAVLPATEREAAPVQPIARMA